MTTSVNYQQIEGLLEQLLELLKSVFSESEQSEVQDFINVGEYGLALETLVDVVQEEDKKISKEALRLIKKLCSLMSVDEKAIERKLYGRIA
jgi:hypothetical protein